MSPTPPTASRSPPVSNGHGYESRDAQDSVSLSGSPSAAAPTAYSSPSGSARDAPESSKRDGDGIVNEGASDTGKGSKNAAGEDASTQLDAPSAGDSLKPQGHPWQAIWSAAHNAYYFWNATNGETTWVNPLDPQASSSASASALAPAPTQHTSEGDEPIDGDLDPDLAFLDPTLYAAARAGASAASSSGYQSRGTFNRLTGRFMPAPGADAPDEDAINAQALRAKRQMGHYFDVDEWERAKERDAENGGKRKSSHHPTKKELQMYKQQRLDKKKRGMGWLHS